MVGKITEQYLMLLDNIKQAESGNLHRNPKETDITSGWGIYKGGKAGASFTPIWEYIDSLAAVVTDQPSHLWTNDDIEAIDKLIDKDKELELSYEFYKEYFKDARLHLFHKDLVVLMSNLYTNSPKGAWSSIQEGLRDVSKDKILPMPLNELSIVDGSFGAKTERALNKFLEVADWKDVLIFKKSVLMAMKTYYTGLIASNPDKFLEYSKGWDNRMETLEHQ